MGQLAVDQALRDDADHLAAGGQRRVRERAHQADPSAPVDDADPAGGEVRPDRGREPAMDRVVARAGTAEDRDAAQRPGASEPEGRQPGCHPPGGAGAMRDRVLLGGRPQPERPTARRLGGRLEDRVVAEATRAPWLGRDPAAARAAREASRAGRAAARRRRGGPGRARTRSARRADRRAGRPARRGAWCCCPCRSRAPRRTAASGRPARRRGRRPRSPNRRRASAGRSPGRAWRALIAALVSNVSPSSTGSSVMPRSSSETSSRVVELEQLPELAQLVRRMGGDEQARSGRGSLRAHRRTVAMTSAWAANRRARPSSARSSIEFAAARSNALPSAVPCSSTYVPAFVPTTFMSTSARESSE